MDELIGFLIGFLTTAPEGDIAVSRVGGVIRVEASGEVVEKTVAQAKQELAELMGLNGVAH